ncbi:MAG: leucyl aminopeptidase [Candidatus Gracilibacteria bacterium]|jgi:leucyl aminopeptidase
MKFSFSAIVPKTDILFLPLYNEEKLSPALQKLLGKKLSTAALNRIKLGDFEGGEKESLELFPEKTACKKFVLVGRGKKEMEDPDNNEFLGAGMAKKAASAKAKSIAIIIDEENFEQVAYGFVLGEYEFTAYKKDPKKSQIEEVIFITGESKNKVDSKKDFLKKLSAFREGSTLSRNLVNTSANELNPRDLTDEAARVAKKYGMRITILDDKKLKKLGCGAIVAVGQGAPVGAHMAIMEYKYKTSKKTPQIAFIGKGVTFDSGGMNLKPHGHIETMKFDMTGAGLVIGLMKTLAELKVPGNFLGVIACAENSLSGTSTHSGDVIKAYNGKTIEIINTDAEGRLVLADALSYTEKNYKPERMVDIATLTGSVIYALGYRITGLIGADQKFTDEILDSSRAAHERFWALPLDKDFIKAAKGVYTDLKNATDTVKAGTIMGGAFLKHFVEKTPWAHIDTAGTAWADNPNESTAYGSTAATLRTLMELALKHQG